PEKEYCTPQHRLVCWAVVRYCMGRRSKGVAAKNFFWAMLCWVSYCVVVYCFARGGGSKGPPPFLLTMEHSHFRVRAVGDLWQSPERGTQWNIWTIGRW